MQRPTPILARLSAATLWVFLTAVLLVASVVVPAGYAGAARGRFVASNSSLDGASSRAWFITPPEGTSPPSNVSRRSLPGYREEIRSSGNNSGSQQQPVPMYFQSSLSVGLPFTSLNRIEHFASEPETLLHSSSIAGRTLRITNRHLTLTVFTPRAGTAGTSIYIPALPYWPGLIANTVFWGTVAWGLVFGVRRLRMNRRRKKGLCTSCAFPVHQSPRCPECGQPTPAAAG